MKSHILQSNGIIGITGPAGAGKTTLAKSLGAQVYSADYRFIGDSAYRRELLGRKKRVSLPAYIDACNQFNWWDWDTIYRDLRLLKSGENIQVSDILYDRASGDFTALATSFRGDETTIYEGAILGPDEILALLDRVFFVVCDPAERLKRLLKSDSPRRTAAEIAARFLITEYSEGVYYRQLFKKKRPTFINGDGQIVSPWSLVKPSRFYLPLELTNEYTPDIPFTYPR